MSERNEQDFQVSIQQVPFIDSVQTHYVSLQICIEYERILFDDVCTNVFLRFQYQMQTCVTCLFFLFHLICFVRLFTMMFTISTFCKIFWRFLTYKLKKCRLSHVNIMQLIHMSRVQKCILIYFLSTICYNITQYREIIFSQFLEILNFKTMKVYLTSSEQS